MTETMPAGEFHSRKTGPMCLSDLTLDRLLLDELPGQEREAVLAHLTACAACAQARTSLEEDRARTLAALDVPRLAGDALARAGAATARPRPWWRWAFAPLAIGAAALLLVPGLRSQPSGTRTKGGLSLTAFVRPAGGGPVTLHGGEALAPGDQVRFRVASDRDGHLVLLGVDSAGHVSVYHPAGANAAPLVAGAGELLPSAVELDDTPGREVMVALRCASPVAVEAAVRAAGAALDPTRVARDPAAALRPLDMGGEACGEARYEITKGPRGGGVSPR